MEPAGDTAVSLLDPGDKVARYTILSKIATGGMSEVYLAQQVGPGQFCKTVVLKVILPHLAGDPVFLRMFHNEAQLAAQLNHPNIVQIFDFGTDDRVHYIAMEYIDGKDLRQVLGTLSKQGLRCPPAIAVRILAEASSALQYAHGFTDQDGRHLALIHRDVSLENILVTFTGQIKLVDFGIARARTVESYTRNGNFRGKLQYVAPEVLQGQVPDHRIDIYAVGVVLYAALLGRLPFEAENDAQLLQKLLNEPPPDPQILDPQLPDDLHEILLRSMHKDRDKRHQLAGQLQKHLEAYLTRTRQVVLSSHIAEFMEATFDRRPQADDDEATNVAEVADIVAPPNDVASAQASSDTSASGWDYEAALRPKRTMRVALIGLTAATMALVGALLYAVYHKDPLPTPIIAAGAVTVHHPSDEDTAIPADGRITLVVEDVHVGDASMAAKTPAAKAVQPRSNVGAAGRTHSRRVRTPAKRRAWHSPSAKRPLKWSTLRVQAPLPGEVLLDGQPLGKLPLTRTPVWPGHHNLIVRSAKRGYTIRRQITVKPGAQLSLQLVPKWGSIRLHVWPWAEVRLDGRNVGTTPLAPIRALEGIHRVVLVNSKLGVRRELRVLVKPAQQTHVKVRLQRSTQP